MDSPASHLVDCPECHGAGVFEFCERHSSGCCPCAATEYQCDDCFGTGKKMAEDCSCEVCLTWLEAVGA